MGDTRYWRKPKWGRRLDTGLVWNLVERSNETILGTHMLHTISQSHLPKSSGDLTFVLELWHHKWTRKAPKWEYQKAREDQTRVYMVRCSLDPSPLSSRHQQLGSHTGETKWPQRKYWKILAFGTPNKNSQPATQSGHTSPSVYFQSEISKNNQILRKDSNSTGGKKSGEGEEIS